MLNYTDDDFTLTGNICYINENGEKLDQATMQQLYNLRWYIQHLIDENEYQYDDDDEWTNPLSESNWIYQTNKTFMKYVNFTLQQMTPEQMKQNPITVHPNQKLDIEEGESNTDEEESTISNKDEEEFTSSQELPEQYSTSDIPTKCTESRYIEIPQEVHTIFVKPTHDEIDSSQDKSVTEFIKETWIRVSPQARVIPIKILWLLGIKC